MCFAVDIIGLIFGVNNFLAAVESIVSGKHVAECNGKQKVRHAVIAEQLKADEQFVTPQKTAAMPTAVQRVGEKPDRFPNRQPNAAPVKNDGTISPPLNPAPNVKAVKSIFIKKASGRTVPSIHCSMILIPVPL